LGEVRLLLFAITLIVEMKVTCLGFQISQELAAWSHGTVDL